MKTSLALVAATCALTMGCATGVARTHSTEALHYADYAGTPIDSFVSFNIDGWESVGRDQLVVWTGVNDAYLLKVWDNCRDLQFAQRIAVTQTGSSVTRGDSVRVGHDRCPISEIRRIDIKQMKLDRAAAKTSSSDGPKP